MAELKTKPTDVSVTDFLNAIPDEKIRQDCWTIADLMEDAIQAPAQMWGDSIIGFGSYHYVYASGRTGDWMRIGFSPRKANISLYLLSGAPQQDELLAKLGKCTQGKGCLYIKRLSDIDLPTLKQLVQATVEHMRATYP